MIGLFNECYPPVMDGVSLTVYNYAHEFHKLGEAVSVIVPKEPGLHSADSPFPIYQFKSMPVPMRKPYRMGLPFFDPMFYDRISELPFSIIHAHCPFSSGKLGLRVARKQGIPFVATFHTKFKDDFSRFIQSEVILNHIIGQIVEFFESADEVWIPQESVGETLRSYGYKGEMTVVENGSEYAAQDISPEEQKEAKKLLGIAPETPLLLFVGQHIWEKNISLILSSLAKIKDIPYQMLFVGNGYAMKDMMKQATQLGLREREDGQPDKVKFIGAVRDREKLKRVYMAADLFLFPSIYDNAPLVVREAAAMHTPSLVVEKSNTAKVITDNVNGFFANNNVDNYADRLRYLLEHPELITKAANGAANSLVRPWSAIAAEVPERYRHLIKKTQK